MTNTPDNITHRYTETLEEGSDNRYFSRTSSVVEVILYSDGWESRQTHYHEPGDMFSGSDNWSGKITWRQINPPRRNLTTKPAL
jgi:hypothetical protein